METVCVKVRLRPGSLPRVRAWAAELGRRSDEAIATLRAESVADEAVFLDRTAEGDFLVYYLRAESVEAARRAVEASPHPIDAFHEAFKRETWESSERLELLVDFHTR